MKRELVLKYLKLFNVGFCLVSGFELIGFIILSFFIPITLNSQEYTIFSLIYTSGLSPIHMSILWILLFTSICILLILAIFLIVIAKNEKIESKTFAKILLSSGIFLLIGNFIKLEAIYVLAKTTIDTFGTPVIFELALYNPSVTPFLGAALWIYFTASVCVYLTSGLVFAAIGLKWMLLLENKKLE
jgi:hypothetical protein